MKVSFRVAALLTTVQDPENFDGAAFDGGRGSSSLVLPFLTWQMKNRLKGENNHIWRVGCFQTKY